MPETLLYTPLHDRHVELGARMVPFAGWEMPVQYEGVIPEHRAVRTDAGVFDVSHMGELEVEGPRARGPSTSISPMCETSKAPQSSRTAMCSGMTPSYCTGISQPANGTMRAPSSTWCSYSGVRRRPAWVGTARMLAPTGL